MLRQKSNNKVKINNDDRKNWQSPNAIFILALMLLVATGLVFVFDTCYTATKTGSFRSGVMQLVFVAIGALICFLLSCCRLRTFKWWAVPSAVISLILLILMFAIGKEVNGATRWIDLGFIQIQPPEFAKIAYVLGLAFVVDISRNFQYKVYKKDKINFNWFWGTIILLFITILCVFLSSMSAFIIFGLLTLAVAYMGNFSKILLGFVILAVIVGSIIYVGKGIYNYNMDNPSESKLKEVQLSRAVLLENALEKDPLARTDEEQILVEDYNKMNLGIEPEKKDVITKDRLDKLADKMSISGSKEKGKIGFRDKRIVVWINPKKYIRDIGLQSAYGLMAISSGGLFGKGLGQGMFKFNIPESHNDYIFPTIVEELGFVGGFILICFYALLFFGGFKIIRDCKNDYGKLLCCGALVVLGAEFFINVMVALNMIPSTGVCLPFISYGGSATIVNFALAGIILAVSRQANLENDEVSPNKIKIVKKRYRKAKVMVPEEFHLFGKDK